MNTPPIDFDEAQDFAEGFDERQKPDVLALRQLAGTDIRFLLALATSESPAAKRSID